MKNKKPLIPIYLILFFLLIHSFKLLSLPVFADESIYIRWSQLIIDNWQRYLFYPMNDGKTPLLMWLMVPFQFIFANQLFSARILSVLFGVISMIFVGLISFEIFKKKKTAVLSSFLYSILPFTFFHNRLAITDALMFANLSISYYLAIKLVKEKKNLYLILLALSFFLALLSKTPAILFIPSFYLTIFFEQKADFKKLFASVMRISLALFLSALIFLGLRITPLFPQLFSVGGNFLHPFEVLWSGEIFKIVANNAKFFYIQLATYLTLPVLLFALPVCKKKKKEQLILFISALVFLLPLMLLGKIVYPRYLLPSSLFLIISSAYFLSVRRHRIIKFIGILIIMLTSFNFIFQSYFNVDKLPLSQADRTQYLEEWSSGHGIVETVEYIEEVSKDQTVAVATEGSFGTLPDGILMYFHGEDVSNLYIEGIGQPVRSIPDQFKERAANFDKQILLVNSHRMLMNLDEDKLIKEFCRPNNAPCLQIWELPQ